MRGHRVREDMKVSKWRPHLFRHQDFPKRQTPIAEHRELMKRIRPSGSRTISTSSVAAMHAQMMFASLTVSSLQIQNELRQLRLSHLAVTSPFRQLTADWVHGSVSRVMRQVDWIGD